MPGCWSAATDCMGSPISVPSDDNFVNVRQLLPQSEATACSECIYFALCCHGDLLKIAHCTCTNVRYGAARQTSFVMQHFV